MTLNKKILLVGHGYWGKILEKNLKDYANLKIVDSLNDSPIKITEEIEKSTHVLIATPASTHYDLVKISIENNCKIFCEKPLTAKHKDTVTIYELLEKKQKQIYVDWIFLCNPVVRKIKSLIGQGTLGNLNYVSMNRLNLGPVRNDVSARHDLASHDLSILSFLLNKSLQCKNKDYYQFEEKVSGTSQVHVFWDDGEAFINVSWNHPMKDRTCVFEFDHATIHWDDFRGIAKINGKNLTLEKVSDLDSPLSVSLKEFFEDSYSFEDNKRITLEVSKLLE